MKSLKYPFVLFALFAVSSIFAQLPAGQCGTLPEANPAERIILNKKRAKLAVENRGGTLFVPIKFHLVATSEGTGRITVERTLDALCKLNEEFEQLDMQFFIQGDFNEIDADVLYNLTFPNVPSSAEAFYVSEKTDDAVNVFVGNGLSSGNSGYYTGQYDVIYMDRSYMNNSDVILAHEMGHFFSLRHTFFGWESTNYNPSQPTPTQVFLGSFAVDVEYVDRDINCGSAADLFCDTPADYITSWSSCNYTGGAVDPDGVAIDPDEANHMGYFSFTNCPDYKFSPNQGDVIVADYYNRPELFNTTVPALMPVTELPNLTFPINDEVVPFDGSVTLEWDAVPNATQYILEISLIPNFGFLAERTLVQTNSHTSLELMEGFPYYWRVKAFNELHFCDLEWSEVSTFSTEEATGTRETISSKNIRLYPNPATGNELNYELDAPLSGEAFLWIQDLRGARLLTTAIAPFQPTGQVDISLLPEGVYVAVIKDGNRLMRKKFVVVR
jgi:hypothetical protein